MTTVLIVDDSAVARESIAHVLSRPGRMEVVGSVGSGEEALSFLSLLKSSNKPLPNVIVMDIVMPGLDGFETTRRIMETTPLPIVIASSGLDIDTAEKTFLALNAGAVAVVQKVLGVMHPDYPRKIVELRQLVEAMATIPVIRRWARAPTTHSPQKAPAHSPAHCIDLTIRHDARLVAIGASTGGPAAIQALLSGLKPGFPLPILVVQHIASGFIRAMAEWMSSAAKIKIHIAEQGERPLPGHVYLAPDERHMLITSDFKLNLVEKPKINGQKPSVSALFASVAASVGSDAIGILLTGMGQDGALELKAIRDAGGLTLAQDKDSSVVYGMPGMAEQLDAAEYFMPPADMAVLLNNVVKRGYSS